uniref:Cyclotide 5 n=1 Tax=Viola baoshanensis TaxID=349688 RepID=Q09PF8_9ROSI|nr:cyclotide precursor 5 [Viola baoshanensis]ACG69856.1 cyclotide precursor 5 [Viola baoshanensis]
MKMFVALVLFAAFALPAAFAAQQDAIALQAYEELLKNGAANGMTETVISNPVLEEALTAFSKKGLEGRLCGERCVIERTRAWCRTVGCICSLHTLECVRNSLPM